MKGILSWALGVLVSVVSGEWRGLLVARLRLWQYQVDAERGQGVAAVADARYQRPLGPDRRGR